METILPYFTGVIAKDLLQLVAGDKLGWGLSRHVYEYLPDPSMVIKFETSSGRFQNVIEWETWERVKYVKNVHQWFAPCIKISSCGMILIQKRTDQRDRAKYPARLPAYLVDNKYQNYGFIGKQFVCHDYGTNSLFENGMTSRMRKVEWREK